MYNSSIFTELGSRISGVSTGITGIIADIDTIGSRLRLFPLIRMTIITRQHDMDKSSSVSIIRDGMLHSIPTHHLERGMKERKRKRKAGKLGRGKQSKTSSEVNVQMCSVSTTLVRQARFKG